ncbi:hypothetical protein E2320_020029, partial [Naja naja]
FKATFESISQAKIWEKLEVSLIDQCLLHPPKLAHTPFILSADDATIYSRTPISLKTKAPRVPTKYCRKIRQN